MAIKVVVNGRKKIEGSVSVKGAKNSVLELIPATLLTSEKVILRNVPNLKDVDVILKLMECFGTVYSWDKKKGTIELQTKNITNAKAPYDIVKSMRASIYVLGALVGRHRYAKVSFPGGCVIGVRPIDLHLRAMKALGVSIENKHGYIIADAKCSDGSDCLHGYEMDLLVTEKNGQKITTHGGCVNAILASVLAPGKTIIKNASLEPEVDDLINMLKLMGANIVRNVDEDDSDCIEIEGVNSLSGVDYSVMPDRMEAMTYAIIGAMNGGVVKIENTDTSVYQFVLQKFKDAGVAFVDEGHTLTVDGGATKLKSVNVETIPYPYFPTDIQSPFAVMMMLADGSGTIEEIVTESRFQIVPEMLRMGAKVKLVNSNKIKITGVKEICGAEVNAAELRGGVALIIAGLCADGETIVHNASYIFRGYDGIIENLKKIGADVVLEEDY